MALTPRRPVPIVELGVAEAYDLLVNRFGRSDLPPLEAIENEDWGRDALLSRFLEVPATDLAEAGLTWDEEGGEMARGRGTDTFDRGDSGEVVQ